MGLDMYAYAVNAGDIDTSTDVDFDYNYHKSEELFYWRKNHYLMGWMAALYKAKGGEGPFNCDPVRLTEFDLDLLIKDIQRKKLTATAGFFFGNQYDYYATQAQRDLEFANIAIQSIREGKDVFFNSSW